jgi:F-type H+-transporting ATPase subunit alpha
LLKQPQYHPLPVEDQVISVFAGTRGYLDSIAIEKVGAFEAQLLSEIKAREPGIIEAIRKDQQIKPETEKSLIAFIENFSRTFA